MTRAMLLLSVPLAIAACAAPAPPPSLPAPSYGQVSVAGAVLAVVSEQSGCSAVALEPDLLVTAGHCVDGFGGPAVVALGRDFAADGLLVDATWRAPAPQPGPVVGVAPDIGLLHVTGRLPTTVGVGTELPSTGDRLTLVGYGCDSKWPPFTRGERGATALTTGGGLLVMDGHVCHGDSGGAVFNHSGALVAVMVARGHFEAGPELDLATLISEALPGLLDRSWEGPKDPDPAPSP